MVSKYELGEKLGDGGMGEVFFGFCTGEHDFRRPVAIKRIRRELMKDELAVSRFIREAQVGAKLDHANIVSVLDLYRSPAGDDGELFLVMEYVPGRSLHDVIEQGAPLPIPAAVQMIAEILSGLEYAHKKGVVHRDIKPHNILITQDTGVVKIADFGIAYLLQGHHDPDSAIAGTLPYCAPEQFNGVEVDTRMDLFSVGVLFYLLLTGQLPFIEREPLAEALMEIMFAPIEPPRRLNPHISRELETVVMRLLERHPDYRYHDAGEVKRDLEGMGDKGALLNVLAELEKKLVVNPAGLSPAGAPPGEVVLAASTLAAAADPMPVPGECPSTVQLTQIVVPGKPVAQEPAPDIGAVDVPLAERNAPALLRAWRARYSRRQRYILAAACWFGVAGLGWSAARVFLGPEQPTTVVQPACDAKDHTLASAPPEPGEPERKPAVAPGDEAAEAAQARDTHPSRLSAEHAPSARKASRAEEWQDTKWAATDDWNL